MPEAYVVGFSRQQGLRGRLFAQYVVPLIDAERHDFLIDDFRRSPLRHFSLPLRHDRHFSRLSLSDSIFFFDFRPLDIARLPAARRRFLRSPPPDLSRSPMPPTRQAAGTRQAWATRPGTKPATNTALHALQVTSKGGAAMYAATKRATEDIAAMYAAFQSQGNKGRQYRRSRHYFSPDCPRCRCFR